MLVCMWVLTWCVCVCVFGGDDDDDTTSVTLMLAVGVWCVLLVCVMCDV